MGVSANDVLDIARGWLGYSEKNGKFKEIISETEKRRYF